MDLIQLMNNYVDNQIRRIYYNETMNEYQLNHSHVLRRVQGRVQRNMDILEILVIYELENIQTIYLTDNQLNALYETSTLPIVATNSEDFITQYRSNQIASFMIMGDLRGFYSWLSVRIATGDLNIMQRVHNMEIPTHALERRYNYFALNTQLRNQIRTLNQIRFNLPLLPDPISTLTITNLGIQQPIQPEENPLMQDFADENNENENPEEENGHNGNQ